MTSTRLKPDPAAAERMAAKLLMMQPDIQPRPLADQTGMTEFEAAQWLQRVRGR